MRMIFSGVLPLRMAAEQSLKAAPSHGRTKGLERKSGPEEALWLRLAALGRTDVSVPARPRIGKAENRNVASTGSRTARCLPDRVPACPNRVRDVHSGCTRLELDMRTMSIKEARSHFSQLIDRAEKGETVIITRNGRKSARVVPMPSHAKALPALGEFRADIGLSGTSLAETVIASRWEPRY